MAEELEWKYAGKRRLFVFLCVVLLIVAIAKIATQQNSHPAFTAANYQRRICDDVQTLDYSKKNIRQFTVTLKQGCFGPRVLIPGSWAQFDYDTSKNVGDYLGVWCSGEPNPRPIWPYFDQHNTQIFDHCFANGDRTTNFYVQGQGTLTFTGLVPQAGAVIGDDPIAAPTESRRLERPSDDTAPPPVAPAYKINPTTPISGASSTFPVLVDECHRDSDQIKCSARMTNTTDEPREMWVGYGGTATDDEGNSFKLRADFSGAGARLHLLPGVSAKLIFSIDDAHRNVRSISFLFNFWPIDSNDDHTTLTFKDIPVQ